MLFAFLSFNVNAVAYDLGAPQADVLSDIHSRFNKVVSIKNAPTRNPGFVGTSYDDGRYEAVTFCNGLLESHTTSIVGGFRAFTRLLQRVTQQRGPGEYEVTAEDHLIGPINSITVQWRERDELFEIGYSLIDQEQTYTRRAFAHMCN
jgi:hypothetical protein